MYFKSLDLIGFKSFAEKTVLNFEPGVTAIVGPNGCGKSNCADAIKWVLGEQSAKSLRASNMQDVIFNGTDTKEPINFAEVSLTFSNENRILPIDYNEVTITRRVFRSGDTEYLLNKTPVRLKDISELLMGTGIGTESYSIIEQGKMDLILSSRPEDRRYIFEEASGITKYKAKKKEALRKLEQTEQNLLRINDIIQEVRRQISSIERQARKAERYKVDFDKLKELEIRISFFDFMNIKTEEKTYVVKSEDLKEREKELDLDVKSASQTIAAYRHSMDDINHRISSLKARHSEMSNTYDMNVHKIRIDEERSEETRMLVENLNKEIQLALEKTTFAKGLVSSMKEKEFTLAASRSEKEKALYEKESLLDSISKKIDDTESRVKAARIQIVDSLAKETKIKNDLIKLGADVQNRNARQRRLLLEKETVRKELDTATEAKRVIEREFSEGEKRALSLRSDLDDKKLLNQDLILAIEALDRDIAQLENQKTAIRSKIEFLEDLVKKHEGFDKGVKSILVKMEEEPHSFGGILGVLADMIKIERGYEEAVNAFLEDEVQLIIAQKDRDAAGAIEYLRANRLGKANFVSLETLERLDGERRPRLPDTGALVNIIPLRDFVKVDARHERMIDYLFSGVFLVDSIEEALSKDFERLHASTLVTKSGLKFDDGRLSGGSIIEGDESILIGRRDRLESFRKELALSEGKSASLDRIRSEKRVSLESIKRSIDSAEEELRKVEMNLSNISLKKETQGTVVKKMDEEMAVVELELEEVGGSLEELKKKGEALNAELNNVANESASLQSFIDESVNSVSEGRATKEQLGLEIVALKAENQSLIKEEAALRNSLSKEEAMLFELEETVLSKEDLLRSSVEKIKNFEDEMASLGAANKSISKEVEGMENDLSGLDAARSGVMDKLSLDELQLKEKETLLESLRNEMRDADVKLTELSYKKTNLRERVLGAYKADLDDMHHVETEEGTDWDSMKSQVSELKERLDKMGPVNLVAIDEHKELEERLSFLTHQEQDLINAKDSLLKAIQKINKTTKELFLDTFQKIQLEFKNFFKTLFSGGQAELILIDEQDVLESGIEIIVRPPGKKLQNIMLLSGGEKALTAIALLFAIFKTKPSPFCVLDEIDAPLDESNINRFSNVLKGFLKTSQFIIITHNKRTIELADVMYGITMQEKGVSKIVSVKFLDNKKSPDGKIPEVEVQEGKVQEVQNAAVTEGMAS